MASLIVLVGFVVLSAMSGFCSYEIIFQQFELGPSTNTKTDDTEAFTRTDLADGLDCIYPADCKDIYTCGRTKTGVYRVFPFGMGEGFLVSCDMTTTGGGWLVIHRRQDGSVDFYRNWQNYSYGFGNLVGEFWLGLDKIHLLTSQRQYELLINLGSYDNGTRSARYSRFFVSDQRDNYRLLVRGYTGTAGDSMAYHNGFEFSTYDRDLDGTTKENCAADRHGAWWYSNCADTNLNGKYYYNRQKESRESESMWWYHWTRYFKPLQTAEMKIRPINQE